MSENRPVVIDVERMQQALAQPFYTLPEGLSREEIRQFILDKAQEIKDNNTQPE